MDYLEKWKKEILFLNWIDKKMVYDIKSLKKDFPTSMIKKILKKYPLDIISGDAFLDMYSNHFRYEEWQLDDNEDGFIYLE